MPGKFYNIDPETCSMEELAKAIKDCKNIEDNYHNNEQACKIFINSIYGAMANKFYYNSNIAMAESITLQGQDLIKYSVKVVNYYFNQLWPGDDVAHTKVADYMKKNSLNLTRCGDMFLYNQVSRTAKPKEDSSGGGSSTHTSSSGETHGGSGGSF